MRRIIVLLLFFLIVFLTACGSDANDLGKTGETEDTELSDQVASSNENSEVEKAEDTGEDSDQLNEITTDRMIIHQAYLNINVKNLEETQLKIEAKVEKYGGYIVQSNVYKEEEDQLNGQITVRIPEKHFQTFLTETEDVAADVMERSVTGEDITEQYVDLESRLKSKRVVEKRLLEFMEEAKKTDDLLKISTELSAVQEEIETIVGKMNYFENQTEYSTVEIWMNESSVVVPNIENKDLDTWEKTKKQFATSINFILIAVSGFVVFFVGNLPVIIILSLIGLGVYLMIRIGRRNRS